MPEQAKLQKVLLKIPAYIMAYVYATDAADAIQQGNILRAGMAGWDDGVAEITALDIDEEIEDLRLQAFDGSVYVDRFGGGIEVKDFGPIDDVDADLMDAGPDVVADDDPTVEEAEASIDENDGLTIGERRIQYLADQDRA